MKVGKTVTMVARATYAVACCIGLVWQVVRVCDSYFRFETATMVQQLLGSRLLLPNIAICSRYIDTTSESPVTRSFEEHRAFAREHTLADLFSLSPDARDALSECRIRSREVPYLMHWHPATTCHQLFNVTRFVMQEQLCYQFSWRQPQVIFQGRVAHSILNGGDFYSLSLCHSLNRFFLVKPILFTGLAPFSSRYLAPGITRRSSESLASVPYSNLYSLQYELFEFELLPPPYDTECIPFFGHYSCTRRCMIERTMDRFGKLPFSEIIYEDDERTRFHQLDPEDMAQGNNSRDYDLIVEDCGRRCRRFPCRYSELATHATVQLRTSHSNMRFVVRGPASAITRVTHEARLYPVEFIVLLLSCFGIWCGLSLTSLDPFDSRNRRAFTRLARHFCRSESLRA